MDYEKLAEFVMIPDGEIPQTPRVGRMPPERGEYYRLDHPRYQGIAEAKGYDQETKRLVRTHYTHDAMIDVIIAEPAITQRELAAKFERSENWISRIMGSDAFQGALAKRREELTDPFLVATIEERFRGLAMQSLDVIAENLEKTRSADVAMKALDISSKALGFGARASGPQSNQQVNFVVHLPSKAENAAAWAAEHTPVIEG